MNTLQLVSLQTCPILSIEEAIWWASKVVPTCILLIEGLEDEFQVFLVVLQIMNKLLKVQLAIQILFLLHSFLQGQDGRHYYNYNYILQFPRYRHST